MQSAKYRVCDANFNATPIWSVVGDADLGVPLVVLLHAFERVVEDADPYAIYPDKFKFVAT